MQNILLHMFFIAHRSVHEHNSAYSGLFGSGGRQTITVQAISRSAHQKARHDRTASPLPEEQTIECVMAEKRLCQAFFIWPGFFCPSPPPPKRSEQSPHSWL
jgi:hypothetical protein